MTDEQIHLLALKHAGKLNDEKADAVIEEAIREAIEERDEADRSDATHDQLCELAGALERELARKTIADVLAIYADRQVTPFTSGHDLACEEILYRLQIAWGEVQERATSAQEGK